MVIRLKRLWLILGGVLLVAAVVSGGYLYYIKEVRVIPEELVASSLENTLAVGNYRYQVSASLELDGTDKRALSDINGEKQKNNFHIKGTMLGQQVEVYQVDDITYSLNPKTQQWMVTPGSELFQPELFMTEINPMSNFRFTQVNNIQYQGVEKNNHQKLHIITCNPVVNNGFLEKYWQDFSYRLWIDRHSERVVKAQISAVSLRDPKDTMRIEVDLKDFNKKFTIKPPESD